MVPGLWQGLSTVLPLRYATDGIRALILMNGNPEAGLGAAWLVLSLYAVGGAGLAWLVSLGKHRLAQGKPAPTADTAFQQVVAD